MLKFLYLDNQDESKKKQHLEDYNNLTSFPGLSPVCITDESSKVVFSNSTFGKLFGLKENERIGSIDADPNLESTTMGLISSNYQGVKFDSYFYEIKKNFRVEIERIILRDKELILYVFEDLSKEQIVSDKLLNLQNAIEKSNIPLIITDEYGKIVYATSFFENILDIEIDVMYNNSVSSIFSFHLSSGDIAELEKSFQEKQNWRSTISYGTEGDIKFYELRLYPLQNSEHSTWKFVLIAYDITDLIQKNRIINKSEKRLRTIINNISDLLLILRKVKEEYIIENVNDNLCETFNFDRNQVLDKNIENIFSENHLTQLLETIRQMDKVSNFIHEFSFTSDEQKNYEGKITEIKDHLGNEKLFIISLHDVTGRLKFETQLKKAYETEVNLNKLKSEFLESMSHELRTPANAIIGYSEIIDDAVENNELETIKELTGSLKEILNRSIDLFMNIVEVSQLEAGETELEFVSIFCNQILKTAYSKKIEDARKKGLNFYFVLDKEDALIRVDWVKFERVLIVLIDNAIKFTEKGEIILRSIVNDEHVDIIINDTGEGLEENKVEELLKPFVQADGGHTRKNEGAGLGLTLAYRLTKLMGGEFNIQSSPGLGTQITLSFLIENNITV